MTRTVALLVAMAALLVACGKYGPPRRVRPQTTASSAAELATGAEPSEATAAVPETGAEPPESDENQEKSP